MTPPCSDTATRPEAVPPNATACHSQLRGKEGKGTEWRLTAGVVRKRATGSVRDAGGAADVPAEAMPLDPRLRATADDRFAAMEEGVVATPRGMWCAPPQPVLRRIPAKERARAGGQRMTTSPSRSQVAGLDEDQLIADPVM